MTTSLYEKLIRDQGYNGPSSYMNPCVCGYYGDTFRQCTCSATMVRKYQQRISGPLLDRIDLHIRAHHAPGRTGSRMTSPCHIRV